MSKIAILADSGCQIKHDQYIQEGIYIVPLQVSIGEQTYLDEVDMDAKEIFTLMKNEKKMITTSQPSTGSLIEVLTQIKEAGYDEVLAISLATGLSSTLNGMKLAADMVEIPITLIDSKGTANNQRYLVKVAQHLINENKPMEEIVTILESLVEDSGTLIMVSDLNHLKRGGRITPAVAMLAGMLKIIPIMKLNYKLGGKIDSFGKVRTVKKANYTIIDYLKENHINDQDYILALEHVLCEELALEMKDYLLQQLNSQHITFGLLPSVVGVHMGIGGIGYQYIRKYKNIEM